MKKFANSKNRKYGITRFVGLAAFVLTAAIFINALPNLTAQAESNGSFFGLANLFGWNTDSRPTVGAKAAGDESDAPTVAPNDTFANAITIGNNSAVNGFIDATTVNDYQLAAPTAPTCFTGAGQTASTAPGRDVVYSFTAPVAGNYSFRAQNTGGTITSGGNLVLYLVSGTPTTAVIPCQAGGTPPAAIAASNRNSNTTVAAEEIFNQPLAAGQQVFLVVDEGTLGTTGTFNFTVEAFTTVLETEPNNTFATRQAAVSGIEGSNSNTATVQDFDYFDLGTPADASRLFAIVDGAAAFNQDFDLRVNTATQTIEYDDAGNDTENGSFAPQISGLPLAAASGPFAMQVDYFGASNATINEPYRLAYVVQPPSASATAEAEPNETTATATSAINNYFSGTFASTTDVDVYATAATQGDLLHVGLDNNPNRNLTTTPNGNFDLLDGAGNVIFSLTDAGVTSTSPFTPGTTQASSTPISGAEATLYRVPATGIYYVRVSASSTTAAAPYLLSISRNGALGGGGTSIPGPGTLQFSSATFAGSEGTLATITVSRSNGNTGIVTVDAAVTGGTATGGAACGDPGVDYITPGTQTLTFADGVNSQSFTVQLCTDFVADPGETIIFGLTNATGGATIGTQSSTTLTITDVPPATLQFASANFPGTEAAPTTATLTVTRTNDTTSSVTVDFTLASGTATGGAMCAAGVDFVNAGGTLTFGAGVNSQTITVTLCDDAVFDPNETFTVTLTNPSSNAVLGTLTTTTVTITDNDAPDNDTFAAPEALTLNLPTVETLSGATNNYTLGTPVAPSCFTGIGQTATTAQGRDRVYSFTPTTPGTYTFSAKFANTGSNLVLYLTTDNPGGAMSAAFGCQNTGGTPPVATNAANRRSATTQSGEEISCVTLAANTTYYLVVDEATAGTGSGTFQLDVTSCNSETEPNNDPASANSIASPITGTVPTSADVDFFRIVGATAGSRVFAMIDAQGSAVSDTQLRITTATDTLEYDDDDGDANFGVSGFNSVIAGTLLPSSDVYMSVDPFTTNLIDPYELIYTVRAAGAETAEVEPNDTIAQANANAPTSYYSGVISATTDVDTYRFNVEPGTLLFAALDTNPSRDGTVFDGTLRLLDANGNVVLTVNGSGAAASNTGSPGTLLGTTPTSSAEALNFRVPQSLVASRLAPAVPVTYYLQVTGATLSATNDYLLSVSGPSAPTAASVNLGGRVMTADGRGIRSARVTMTEANGTTHTILTGPFGSYRFTEVAAGQSVVISVYSKRFSFEQPTQIIDVIEEATELNFVSSPGSIPKQPEQ